MAEKRLAVGREKKNHSQQNSTNFLIKTLILLKYPLWYFSTSVGSNECSTYVDIPRLQFLYYFRYLSFVYKQIRMRFLHHVYTKSDYDLWEITMYALCTKNMFSCPLSLTHCRVVWIQLNLSSYQTWFLNSYYSSS